LSKRLGLLIQGVALVGVAALVATLVVVVRTTGPSLPSAPTQPLQVGLDAPSNADVAETIPVAISAVGPDPVQRIELWVGPAMVEALELENLGETSSVTLHWPALTPGEATTGPERFDLVVQHHPLPAGHFEAKRRLLGQQSSTWRIVVQCVT